jgi:hypothetical protein
MGIRVSSSQTVKKIFTYSNNVILAKAGIQKPIERTGFPFSRE